MASAEDPNNTGAAIYNEDEDLLDDEDDDDSSDHGEDVYLEADVDVDDDSASSSPATASASVSVADRPAASVTAAQVTVAVADAPDFRVSHHQQQQQHQHVSSDVVIRKPQAVAYPDESRKLFQRLWTDEDEIELLQGFLEYTTQRGPHSSSHHHDTTAFYDQIKDKLQLDFNKNQLVEKLRRLKKKYRNVISKSGSGKDHAFKSPHDQATFEISSKIWGDIVGVNGSTAVRAAAATAPVAVVDDDNDPNNPNYVAGNQSPNPNGLDGSNSKTPRSRKRNRAGAVKVEEKQQQQQQQHQTFTITPQNNQQVTPMAMATPIASISNVIEETVRSCFSPFFKELLGNSMNLNGGPHRGFGLALSPMPLGFSGVTGGEKFVDEKWRKQQILELEVFSKRLELVQDQIKAQLEELRSIGS